MIKIVIIIIAVILGLSAMILILNPDLVDAITTGYETEPWTYRADFNYPIDEQFEGAWGHVITFTYDDGSTTMITRENPEGLSLFRSENSIVSMRYDLYAKLKDDRYETVEMDLSGTSLWIYVGDYVLKTEISDTTTAPGGIVTLQRGKYIPVYTASATVANIMDTSKHVAVVMMPIGNPQIGNKRIEDPHGYAFTLREETDGKIWLKSNVEGDVYKLITDNPFD